MTLKKFNIFENVDQLAEKFSDFIISESSKHSEDNPYSIALSGGSTPKKIFEYISKNKIDQINWSNLAFYWGDERCVPPDNEQSNYLMTRLFLLDHIKSKQPSVFRIHGEMDPNEEIARYSKLLEKKLNSINSIPQFDLTILGLGDDGHTASIFPHQIELWNSPNNCVVAAHPESGQKRISLTGRVINQSKNVLFLVTGKNKSAMVKNIAEGSVIFPASLVSPVSNNLFWFLDVDAASMLQNG